MTRVQWGTPGTRFYEGGVDRGVLYVGNKPGVAWSGLTSVSESPSGGDPKQYYLDGVNYMNVARREEFKGTIEAYYSPVEFDACDGIAYIAKGLSASQQPRKPFHLSYRSKIGNDLKGLDYGYKIHLVYNALATPTNKHHSTSGSNTDADPLSWSFITKPVRMAGMAPTAHLTIDSTEARPDQLAELEDILYGDNNANPRMPTIVEVASIFGASSGLIVEPVATGLYAVRSLDTSVVEVSPNLYRIEGPTVLSTGPGTYLIESQ